MVLFLIIIGIAVLSVVLSYLSLTSEMRKGKHVDEVKKKLQKGRVLFYSPSSSKP